MMVLVLSVFGLSPLYASDGQSRRIYRYEDKLQPEQVWKTGGYIGMYRKCECSFKWKKTVENDLETGVMDDLKPYGSFHWTLCLNFLLRVRCLHGLWQEKLPALETVVPCNLKLFDFKPLVRGTCPMCQQPTCNWLSQLQSPLPACWTYLNSHESSH